MAQTTRFFYREISDKFKGKFMLAHVKCVQICSILGLLLVDLKSKQFGQDALSSYCLTGCSGRQWQALAAAVRAIILQ